MIRGHLGLQWSKGHFHQKCYFSYKFHGMVIWLMHMHQLDALYNSHRSIGHIGFIWGHWGQIMIVIGLPQLQHIKLSKVSCWMGDHIK